MKVKVIQVNSASHSFSMENYEQDIFKSWYAMVALQLKKYFPKLLVECWSPERHYKRKVKKLFRGIQFKIFPTNFSIRHGMEISKQMVRGIQKEVKKAQEENYRLIIHIHEYHSWLIYILLRGIKKNKNIKIIAQHHGARSPFENLKKYKRLFIASPLFLLMQFLENLVLKKIDFFYALSDEELNYLSKKTGSVRKFQTMGIGDEYFEEVSREFARKELGLSKNKKYVLYIGRLAKTKGIGELLDAWKSFNGDTELILIGEGVEFDKFKKYAHEKNIHGVNFLGLIYGRRKLLYLSAVDCLILPSYTEGAPVVLMEAIAKNLPVIASDVGGVKKMIENGREGLIMERVSSQEIIKSIKEVLSWDKKEIKKYGEIYRWDKIIHQTHEDYKKC